MPFNITQEFVQQLLEQIAQLTKQVSELTAEISELQQTIKELEEKKNRNSKNSSKPLHQTAMRKNLQASMAGRVGNRAGRKAMKVPTLPSAGLTGS